MKRRISLSQDNSRAAKSSNTTQRGNRKESCSILENLREKGFDWGLLRLVFSFFIIHFCTYRNLDLSISIYRYGTSDTQHGSHIDIQICGKILASRNDMNRFQYCSPASNSCSENWNRDLECTKSTETNKCEYYSSEYLYHVWIFPNLDFSLNISNETNKTTLNHINTARSNVEEEAYCSQ